MAVLQINNRRYLGNKYKLLPFIRSTIAAHCHDVRVVADLFAGTGAVSHAFNDTCTVITNDILYSNYLSNFAWFGAEDYDSKRLASYIECYNALNVCCDNYMSDNFADTYFSRDDCRRIGFIRQNIENEFLAGHINFREKALLITSLLYAMDKIAMTCGHYDAYRKNAVFEGRLELRLPDASHTNNPQNRCYNSDINILAPQIQADLVYLDPPYNSRQYCDAYHLPENVARWEKPQLFGVARKMDRSALKSDYCTRNAAKAFANLVENLHARYIVLSYSNMAQKGNSRSNACMSDSDIMQILRSKGHVEVFSSDYKAFTTGKSAIADHEERLFICTCRQ